jgi:hypothetical protein
VVAAPAVEAPSVVEVPGVEVLEEMPLVLNTQAEAPTATATEEQTLETVDDVMKALNEPGVITETVEPEVAVETVKPEAIEAETTDAVIEAEDSTVESVDNLPIADKVIDLDVSVAEPAVEIAAPVAITTDIVTEELGDSGPDGVDVLAPKEEPLIESVIPPGQ